MKSLARLVASSAARPAVACRSIRSVKISKLVSSKTAWGNFAAHKYSTAAAGDAKPAAQAPMSKAEKERARVEMARKNITPAKPKLDQVVKLELLQNETPDRITEIWKAYHKDRYTVASVIPAEVYERVHSKFAQYPNFIVPLPKEQGAEFFWMQMQGNMLLFSRLLEFKVRKEQAKPCLIIAHYTELAGDKGIVLMRGEIDPAVLTPPEAQTLLNQAQAFYLDAKRFEIVKKFHSNPDEFNYEKILIDMPIQTRIVDPEDDAHGPNQ